MYKRQILGRVAAIDIVNPDTQETAITAGTLLDEDMVDMIDRIGVDEVKVRTPLTCETRHGLCAHCYGCLLYTSITAFADKSFTFIMKTPPATVPVSYTHLDVYKRQPRDPARQRNASATTR